MRTLQECKEMVDGLTGIKKLVIVHQNGTVLLQSGSGYQQLGNYVAYIAMMTEQLKPHLSLTGPYSAIMEQTSGEQILTIFGKQLQIGLYLEAQVSPVIILDQLLPQIDQITI